MNLTKKTKTSVLLLLLFLSACGGSAGEEAGDLSLSSSLAPPENETTAAEGFKVAFIGDQGISDNAAEVLKLIKAEGADAVVHLGDFDYQDDPEAWERQINNTLGRNFPYFSVIGNHDEEAWDEGKNGGDGYQKKIASRFNRLGLSWTGDLGLKSSFKYKGVFFVLTAPGTYPDSPVWDRTTGAEDFIAEHLAGDDSIWKICAWHKNMNAMQVGAMPDETGWEVYEECRRGGAIIATAHEHSYQRTKTLAEFDDPFIVSLRFGSTLLHVGPGSTFVFVSGLGGESIHRQRRCLPVILHPWQACQTEWASIYMADQGATFGALFITFGVDGKKRKGRGYFKNIHGEVVDSFEVLSEN